MIWLLIVTIMATVMPTRSAGAARSSDDELAEAIVDPHPLERGRLLRLDGPSVRTKHLPGERARRR